LADDSIQGFFTCGRLIAGWDKFFRDAIDDFLVFRASEDLFVDTFQTEATQIKGKKEFTPVDRIALMRLQLGDIHVVEEKFLREEAATTAQHFQNVASTQWPEEILCYFMQQEMIVLPVLSQKCGDLFSRLAEQIRAFFVEDVCTNPVPSKKPHQQCT